MMGGFLDWAGRVVMLVLAGMVTLSIIGAIAAIPSGSIETRMGLETQSQIADQPPLPETRRRAVEAQADPPVETDGQGVVFGAPGAPAPAEGEAARWLEAITYALLALVGLVALGTLLLWRGLRERRRAADALEELAAQR